MLDVFEGFAENLLGVSVYSSQPQENYRRFTEIFRWHQSMQLISVSSYIPASSDWLFETWKALVEGQFAS